MSDEMSTQEAQKSTEATPNFSKTHPTLFTFVEGLGVELEARGLKRSNSITVKTWVSATCRALLSVGITSRKEAEPVKADILRRCVEWFPTGPQIGQWAAEAKRESAAPAGGGARGMNPIGGRVLDSWKSASGAIVKEWIGDWSRGFSWQELSPDEIRKRAAGQLAGEILTRAAKLGHNSLPSVTSEASDHPGVIAFLEECGCSFGDVVAEIDARVLAALDRRGAA